MADRGFLHRIALATRIKTVPLALGGVLVVSADAAGRELRIDGWRLGTCLLIAALLHVAAILVSDVFDHRAGTDKLARLDRNAMPTGGLQLEARTMTVRQVSTIAAMFLGVAAVLVASLRDPVTWGWFGVALACLWTYAAPPLRVAYVGSGFGELVVAVAYGPALGAATAQALGVPRTAGGLLAASVCGVLVAMTFGSHHFLHWRADREASKRTPVVVFGEDGAFAFVGVVDLLAYLTLLGGVLAGVLPAVCATALVGAPGIAVALRRAQEDPVPQRILGLIGVHLAAVVFAVAGLSAGLLLR